MQLTQLPMNVILFTCHVTSGTSPLSCLLNSNYVLINEQNRRSKHNLHTEGLELIDWDPIYASVHDRQENSLSRRKKNIRFVIQQRILC